MKKQITLRLDEEVIEWFRSGGEGYQTRMNEALRGWMDGIIQRPDLSKGPIEMVAFTHGGDIDFNEDNFFKPMPKPEKGKKPRCGP